MYLYERCYYWEISESFLGAIQLIRRETFIEGVHILENHPEIQQSIILKIAKETPKKENKEKKIYIKIKYPDFVYLSSYLVGGFMPVQIYRHDDQ